MEFTASRVNKYGSYMTWKRKSLDCTEPDIAEKRGQKVSLTAILDIAS